MLWFIGVSLLNTHLNGVCETIGWLGGTNKHDLAEEAWQVRVLL